MSDRVSIDAGDAAVLRETLNDATGSITADAIDTLTLTVWRCGVATPVIDARDADVDSDHAGGGVDVHCSISGLDTRGLYLARWRGTLSDGQILSFPSDLYTMIEVTGAVTPAP
jgi:hypothetical protein